MLAVLPGGGDDVQINDVITFDLIVNTEFDFGFVDCVLHFYLRISYVPGALK
jgi:hypothetical protein